MSKHNIIADKNKKQVAVPTLPLILIKENGETWEADSIHGLICCLSNDYEDAEDNIDDWHIRVKLARRIAMLLVDGEIDIAVYDEKHGILKNNYAAQDDDDDYSSEKSEAFKLNVTSEKSFLKGLVELNYIIILEREDSKQFLDLTINCSRCTHNDNEICKIYNCKIEDYNFSCDSGAEEKIREYKGGTYNIIRI